MNRRSLRSCCRFWFRLASIQHGCLSDPQPPPPTQQLFSSLMQSRTHQPGHWSPWETTADVKGEGEKKKSGINPTQRRFYDDGDGHARLSHADVLKRHTSGPTHLEYDPPAVHPGGGGGFFTRAGLVSSGGPLTEAALMSNCSRTGNPDRVPGAARLTWALGWGRPPPSSGLLLGPAAPGPFFASSP